MWEMMNTNIIGFTIGLASFAVVGFMIYGIVGGLISFVVEQGKALKHLYTHRTYELDGLAGTFTKLHPYTQGILNNSCPELRELRELRSEGRMEAARGVLQSMLGTLKHERNGSVRRQIVKQLRKQLR